MPRRLIGDIVQHSKYGLGKVLRTCAEGMVLVQFGKSQQLVPQENLCSPKPIAKNQAAKAQQQEDHLETCEALFDIPPESEKSTHRDRKAIDIEIKIRNYLVRIGKGDKKLNKLLEEEIAQAGIERLNIQFEKGEYEITSKLFESALIEVYQNPRKSLLTAAVLVHTENEKVQLREVFTKIIKEECFGAEGPNRDDEIDFVIQKAGNGEKWPELEAVEREIWEKGKQRRAELEAVEREIREEEKQRMAELRERERKFEEERRKEKKQRSIELEEKRRKEKELIELKEAIRSEVKRFYNTIRCSPIETNYKGIKIAKHDLALIYKWADMKPVHNDPPKLIDDLKARLGADFPRLLSARIAEIASINYYSSQNKTVIDISLKQLEGRSSEWITHDLLVDDQPIDVKNSRRSFSSPTSYSEHCVPRFKVANRNNIDVTIVGVLSSYFTLDQVENPTIPTECSILGEVTRKDVEHLQAWLTKEFGNILQILLIIGSGFIPGWMFDYPMEQNTSGNNSPNDSSPIIDRALRERQLEEIPTWLFAFSDDLKLVQECLGEVQFGIWKTLQSARQNIGYSRRSIYGAILAHTLSMAVSKPNNYQPSMWNEWLFPPGNFRTSGSFRRPLGLLDSEKYIYTLIETLETMWMEARDQLSQFRAFKLSGPNILKARTKDGDWQTILAYCGGWMSKPKVKCGNNPIFLGQSEPCLNCHKLICPKCRFCEKTCEFNGPRQEGIGS